MFFHDLKTFSIMVTPDTPRKCAKALKDADTPEEARCICDNVKANTFELSGESFAYTGYKQQCAKLSAEVAGVCADGYYRKTGRYPDARNHLDCVAFEMNGDGSVRRRFKFKSYF